jgi:hypothetical protein
MSESLVGPIARGSRSALNFPPHSVDDLTVGRPLIEGG